MNVHVCTWTHSHSFKRITDKYLTFLSPFSKVSHSMSWSQRMFLRFQFFASCHGSKSVHTPANTFVFYCAQCGSDFFLDSSIRFHWLISQYLSKMLVIELLAYFPIRIYHKSLPLPWLHRMIEILISTFLRKEQLLCEYCHPDFPTQWGVEAGRRCKSFYFSGLRQVLSPSLTDCGEKI